MAADGPAWLGQCIQAAKCGACPLVNSCLQASRDQLPQLPCKSTLQDRHMMAPGQGRTDRLARLASNGA